ncbi:MAG: cation efflux protein, CzcI family [Rhodocyclaceae bacterium]
MRRFLAIALLVFLPFQFSWAAVAGYCQHETEGSARHFGHHEHKHQADTHEAAPDTKLAGGIDNDCGACHAGCCAAAVTRNDSMPPLAAASPLIPWLKNQLASPPGSQPERPNWSVLA